MDSAEIIPNLERTMGEVAHLSQHVRGLKGLQPDDGNGDIGQQLEQIREQLAQIDRRVRLIEETGISTDFVMSTGILLKDLEATVGRLENETLAQIDARLRRLEQLAGEKPTKPTKPTKPARPARARR